MQTQYERRVSLVATSLSLTGIIGIPALTLGINGLGLEAGRLLHGLARVEAKTWAGM